MLNIGPQELLLILVVALIVVGPTRLPELGRSIGKGLREIRKAQDEVKRTIQVNLDEPPAPKKASKPGSPQPAAETPGTDTGGLAAEGSEGAEGAEGVPPAIGPDPVPLASEPAPKSEVLEISRTLGRSLAELRRAKEEVQKSFRVDLADERAGRPTPKPARDQAPVAPSDVAPAGPSPADEAPTG